MTSRVYINIEADTAVDARHEMARLLGLDGDFMSDEVDATVKEMLDTAKAPQPPVDNDHVAEGAEQFSPEVIAANAPTPTRERGKPSPGHARRTKAEIAEDDAALKDDLVKNIEAHGYKPTGEVNAFGAEYKKDDAADKASADIAHDIMTEAANATPAISTGDERISPEDGDEVQTADAADEAAETAASTAERVAEGKSALTLDDIRTVLGNYQKAYGLPACMEDGPKIIGEVVTGAIKVSDVPEDRIADVIAALKDAGKTNRFDRTLLVAS